MGSVRVGTWSRKWAVIAVTATVAAAMIAIMVPVTTAITVVIAIVVAVTIVSAALMVPIAIASGGPVVVAVAGCEAASSITWRARRTLSVVSRHLACFNAR